MYIFFLTEQNVIASLQRSAIQEKKANVVLLCLVLFLQIRAKLKGKLTKDGYLEIPVVIASSDDETVLQAQKSAEARPASQRPKRRKGTFFCVTGKNSLHQDQNNSDIDLSDQEEVDDFISSLTSRSKRNRRDNFTENSNNLTKEANFYYVSSSRRESDSSVFINNGQFKLMSTV